MEKFYTFKNATESGADLYVYGALVDEKDEFYGAADVDFTDFKNAIEGMQPGAVLNMFINSGGGSVFAASAMVSILDRAKAKGVKLNAYIDGLCASAATYLAMAADTIYTYKNSVLMIHKPATWAAGNADDLAKEIEVLDKIQNDVMLPLYMQKSKVSAEKITEMVDAETWLTAAEISDVFEVEAIDEAKPVAACISPELLNMYKHTPEVLKVRENANLDVEKTKKTEKLPENTEPAPAAPDYSKYLTIIENLKIRGRG